MLIIARQARRIGHSPRQIGARQARWDWGSNRARSFVSGHARTSAIDATSKVPSFSGKEAASSIAFIVLGGCVCTAAVRRSRAAYFLTGAGPPRGGVVGRPDSAPPNDNLLFFSAGRRTWNEHIRLSSMLIRAPALSNSPKVNNKYENRVGVISLWNIPQ